MVRGTNSFTLCHKLCDIFVLLKTKIALILSSAGQLNKTFTVIIYLLLINVMYPSLEPLLAMPDLLD